VFVFFFCWGGGARPDYFLFQLQEKEKHKTMFIWTTHKHFILCLISDEHLICKRPQRARNWSSFFYLAKSLWIQRSQKFTVPAVQSTPFPNLAHGMERCPDRPVIREPVAAATLVPGLLHSLPTPKDTVAPAKHTAAATVSGHNNNANPQDGY
jgi:hypothetical protein